MTKIKWILLATCLLGVYHIGHVLFPRIVIVTTASIRYSVFFRSEEKIELYDYIVFTNPSTFSKEHIGRLVTKQIECVYPQKLTVDSDHRFYCDGSHLGTARTVTRAGKVLPVFMYEGQIPQGKAFVMGSHEDSFDSRYFGLVDLENAQRVVPII